MGTEIEDLRDEVAFWRREVAATIWVTAALFRAAKTDDERANIAVRLQPMLAAFASADAKDWFDECEFCGTAIRPGEAYLPGAEDAGPRCKAHLYGEHAAAAPGTPEEVARDVAEAKALLDQWRA